MLSVSPVSSVLLKTSIVLRLNESFPSVGFLFIIIFCFIRFVMIFAKASLVMLEAVVLVMKSNVDATSGPLWLHVFLSNQVTKGRTLKWSTS